MQQRVAQGGDRRERVHDFMRQDARQLAPRFDLHLAQLAVDVAHDHHAQPAFFEYDLRTSQRQAHFARFGHARHMVLFARADRRQYPVCFGSGQFQLLDVGQARQPEDAQRLAVCLVDAPRVVDGDKPCACVLHDQLVVAFPLFGAYLGAHQDLLDTVQGGVEHAVVHFRRVFMEAEREVVVVDGVEHEGYTAYRIAVKPYEAVCRDPDHRDEQDRQRVP